MFPNEVTPPKRLAASTKLIHLKSESGEDGEGLVEFREFARLFWKASAVTSAGCRYTL